MDFVGGGFGLLKGEGSRERHDWLLGYGGGDLGEGNYWKFGRMGQKNVMVCECQSMGDARKVVRILMVADVSLNWIIF